MTTYQQTIEHATIIVCAAAQRFADQRISGSFDNGPLIVGGNINPDKVTVEEIAASIALLRSTTINPNYTGPRPLFGRNCYGSNLPPVG